MKDWRAYPVVIVASGPSLVDEQCAVIASRRAQDACRVIVVNDCFKKVPTADVVFAADTPWIKLHEKELAPLTMAKWSTDRRASAYGFTFIPSEAGSLLPPATATNIKRGSSSGFMAAQTAILFCGAVHVILVGMDCKRSADGRAHWFGDHDPRLRNPQPFLQWAHEWAGIVDPCKERGIDIVNCSLDSDIRLMRRSTLESELFPCQSP